jgi:thiosulfate/3-mercaptopyruvate sulfurtransferase
MTGRDRVLVSAGELLRRLDAGERPVILDVRWRLDRPDGRPAYLAGHLPGAVYVSLEDELSDHSVTGRGRHPLPSGAVLQTAARRWGITADCPVIVYDDWNRAGSARARWVLTAAGLTDVRILDGGLSAWTAAGGTVETGAVIAVEGDVVLSQPDLYTGARATLSAEQIAAGEVATLIDARAPERFSGAVEPIDPVAGHIPGAVNLPSVSVLDDSGRFRPAAEIGALVTEAAEPVGVYCGSGVTAAVVIAALDAAGIDAALFPGSWSQWSSDPGLPVERG